MSDVVGLAEFVGYSAFSLHLAAVVVEFFAHRPGFLSGQPFAYYALVCTGELFPVGCCSAENDVFGHLVLPQLCCGLPFAGAAPVVLGFAWAGVGGARPAEALLGLFDRDCESGLHFFSPERANPLLPIVSGGGAW